KPKIQGSLTRKFRTTNVDWTKFESLALSKLRYHNETVNKLTTKESVFEFIDSFVEALQDICNRTLPKSKPPNKEVYWFTEELQQLKLEVGNLQRGWKRQTTDF